MGLPSIMSTMNRAPALFTVADYYGTLAAVRSLGRAGIPVTIADPDWSATACWSRFVTQRVRCPRVDRPEELIEWLVGFGRREPGYVLYPTNDDTAWLFAVHRKELSQHFRTYQPPVEAVYALLNKQRLFEACRDTGVDVPPTWFPTDDAGLEQVAREARFPLLMKPITQVMFTLRSKGLKITTAEQLIQEFYAFDPAAYAPSILQYDPSVARPSLQQYMTKLRMASTVSRGSSTRMEPPWVFGGL